MYAIADSAFKRMPVDARACQLDTDEHHRGLALRTSGALNCNEWNDGRQVLRLGHDASLELAGARHSLSPVMPRRRSGDRLSMHLQGPQTRVNSADIRIAEPTFPTPGRQRRQSLWHASIERVSQRKISPG